MKSVLALLSLISVSGHAQMNSNKPPLGSKSQPTIPKVIELVKKQNIRTVEDLLDKLALHYPDLNENPVMVYKGRSPEAEDASPLYPRVLLGAPQGKFFLGYTTDPTKPNFRRVVMLEAGDSKSPKAPHFTEIAFASKNQAPHIDTQPQTCILCHALPGRPIFDSYNLWPGMYGSSDRMAHGAEPKNLKKLAETKTHHTRLKHLRFGTDTIENVDKANLDISTTDFSAKTGSAVLSLMRQALKQIPRDKLSRVDVLRAVSGCKKFEALLPARTQAAFRKEYPKTLQYVRKNVVAYYRGRRERYIQAGGEPVPNDAVEGTYQWDDKLGGEYAGWAKITARLMTLTQGQDAIVWPFLSSTLERNTLVFMDGNNTYESLACGLLTDPEYLTPKESQTFMKAIDECKKENSNRDLSHRLLKPLCGDDETVLDEDIEADNQVIDKLSEAHAPTPLPRDLPSGHLALKVFKEKCIACHSDERADHAIAFLKEERFRISLHRTAKPKIKGRTLYLSEEIIRRIQAHLGEDQRMPLGAAALSPTEIKAIEEYIKGLDVGQEKFDDEIPTKNHQD